MLTQNDANTLVQMWEDGERDQVAASLMTYYSKQDMVVFCRTLVEKSDGLVDELIILESILEEYDDYYEP